MKPIVGIGIDPGVKLCAYAYSDGYAIRSGMIHWSSLAPALLRAEVFGCAIIELPRIVKSMAPPEDILQLARVAGCVEAMCTLHGFAVRMVRPSDWKGSVPKPIHNARVMHSLEHYGLTLNADVAPSKRHNCVDAAGLLLFSNGLTDTAGIPHRP